MLQLNPTNRNVGTVALDQLACLFKLHSASVHVCSTFCPPAAQASLLQGQQTYLPLRMLDYVAMDQQTCLKPSSYVCNSLRMLQYPWLLQLHQASRPIPTSSQEGNEHLQHADTYLTQGVVFCVDTLHSTSIFVNFIHPSIHSSS